MNDQLKLYELELEFIKLEKKLANKHQADIAEKTKVSWVTVWRWIKGVTKPSERDVESILNYGKENMVNDLKGLAEVINLIVCRIENGKELEQD